MRTLPRLGMGAGSPSGPGRACRSLSGSFGAGGEGPVRRDAHGGICGGEGYAGHAGALPDPSAARLQVPGPALRDEGGMLRPGADGCLPGLDAPLCRERAVQALYGGGLPGGGPAHRGGMGAGGDLGALRHARVAGARTAGRAALPHGGMRRRRAGHVRGGRLRGMHEAAAGIDADVRPAIRNASPCPSWTGAPWGRARPLSFVEPAASMEAASTMGPPRIMIPASSGRASRSRSMV